MDADYLVQTLDFIQRMRKLAKKEGMQKFETGSNFDRFRDICAETGEPLSEHFDDAYFDRLHQYGTWVAGRDKRGRVIAMAALRLDDLGETTLGESLPRQLRRINGGLGVKVAPGAENFKGRTVYSGQYWLHKDFRGLKLAPAFSALVQALALLQYSPNVHYGLTDKKLVDHGFGVRSRFTHGQLHVRHWLEPPRYLPDYHILWNELKDLHWMVEQESKECVQDEQTQRMTALHSRTR